MDLCLSVGMSIASLECVLKLYSIKEYYDYSLLEWIDPLIGHHFWFIRKKNGAFHSSSLICSNPEKITPGENVFFRSKVTSFGKSGMS